MQFGGAEAVSVRQFLGQGRLPILEARRYLGYKNITILKRSETRIHVTIGANWRGKLSHLLR